LVGLKRLKRLKRLKEFKVERVKGKVAERGGGGSMLNDECGMLNAAWRGIREGRSAAGGGLAAPARSGGG
jgi:hypothetical protein